MESKLNASLTGQHCVKTIHNAKVDLVQLWENSIRNRPNGERNSVVPARFSHVSRF